jgi:E3 SUMO-protein ligase NSE2
MPAMSRRKSHRRQASSDIEDGQSTQRSARDEVDEEEEEQPRPTKRIASSKKGKGRATAIEKAPAEDSDNDTERIDVSNFSDQPLRREDMVKINGLGRDWQAVADQISNFGPVFGSVGASIADTSSDESAQKVCPYLIR